MEQAHVVSSTLQDFCTISSLKIKYKNGEDPISHGLLEMQSPQEIWSILSHEVNASLFFYIHNVSLLASTGILLLDLSIFAWKINVVDDSLTAQIVGVGSMSQIFLGRQCSKCFLPSWCILCFGLAVSTLKKGFTTHLGDEQSSFWNAYWLGMGQIWRDDLAWLGDHTRLYSSSSTYIWLL
ncbi:hypothetical protein CR513_12094, partial [Mucuna pruriens]